MMIIKVCVFFDNLASIAVVVAAAAVAAVAAAATTTDDDNDEECGFFLSSIPGSLVVDNVVSDVKEAFIEPVCAA